MPTPDAPGAAPLLNAKRERFVREYLLDLNALQAAARAGYSNRTAGQQGSRLLKDVEVATRIVYLQSQIVERTDLSIEWVLQELRATYAAARACDQLNAANKAVELLGRHIGMWPSKVELTGKDGAPLIPPGRIEPEAIPERLREFFATAGRN